MKEVYLGGVKWIVEEVERDYHMTPKEQCESLAEDYEGFDVISILCGKIRFYYLRKKEGVA